MMLFFLQVMHGCEVAGALPLLQEIKAMIAQMAGSGDLVTITRAEYHLLRDRVAALSLEVEMIVREVDRITDTL